MYDAIVIGSGIGGLTAAGLLAGVAGKKGLARIFQPIPLYGRIEAILLVMARERQRFAGIASAGRCNRR